MLLTCDERAAVLKHVLENVLQLEDDSPVHQTIKCNRISTPFDIIQMSEAEIDTLDYKDDDSDSIIPIPCGRAGLLKALKAYSPYMAGLGKPIDERGWL